MWFYRFFYVILFVWSAGSRVCVLENWGLK
jgi:hypothetical protein